MRTWERFWFAPGDPTTLGFMRLLGGLLIFYIHLSYSFDLQTFFGRDAWLTIDKANEFRRELPMLSPGTRWDRADEFVPRTPEDKAFMDKWGFPRQQSIAKGRNIFSLWYHLSDPVQMRIAHGVILVVMFLFAVGFCSRVTGVLTWIFLLGYINRSNVSVFGVDTMMNMLCMYLIVGPSGAALSVDRWIERKLAARRGVTLPPPAPSVSANLALRLVQINFCMVYGMSGLSKLQGGSWWTGTATWLTMVNYEFSPVGNRLYMYIIRSICAQRWLWELAMLSSTMMTLVLELTMPLMIWNRKLRLALHLRLLDFPSQHCALHGLVCFSLMMLAMLVNFVPGWTIREFFGERRPASTMALLHPKQATPHPHRSRAGSRGWKPVVKVGDRSQSPNAAIGHPATYVAGSPLPTTRPHPPVLSIHDSRPTSSPTTNHPPPHFLIVYPV